MLIHERLQLAHHGRQARIVNRRAQLAHALDQLGPKLRYLLRHGSTSHQRHKTQKPRLADGRHHQ